MRRVVTLIISLTLIVLLSACRNIPQVRAEQRLFLNLSLEFLGNYELPKQTFEGTPVGGLSAITYDRQSDRFYTLSDDRSGKAPARFYTLKLKLADKSHPNIEEVSFEKVTFLKTQEGKTYSSQTIDPEGISLSPRGTVFISSEGVPNKGIDPLIGEFDLATGQLEQTLPLPQRYLPAKQPDENPRGIEENLGFEALTISATSTLKDDPFRLFTATESSLKQDTDQTVPGQIPVRLLHYVISSIGTPLVIAEHLYLLDQTPKGAILNGLTELIALQPEGYWLSLERTFGLFGYGAKLFQVVNINGSDTSNQLSLKGELKGVSALKKKLLLDLRELNLELDNLEGITLGPRLPDGRDSLILISDDNFSQTQVTQLLLFALNKT